MATLAVDTVTVIRISKEELFNDLKTENPSEFGTKVWADVEFVQEDPNDTSYIEIQFKPEAV